MEQNLLVAKINEGAKMTYWNVTDLNCVINKHA